MKVPSAAELKQRIIIRSMTITRGADGSVVETPATYATTYARMTPLRGSEDYVAQGISASVVYEVWTRYLSGVTPNMDFTFDGRTFSIESVRNFDESSRWLIMTATEDV